MRLDISARPLLVVKENGMSAFSTKQTSRCNRASDLRFRSAISVCQLDMRLRPHTSMIALRGKTLVESSFDLTLFVKRLLYER